MTKYKIVRATCSLVWSPEVRVVESEFTCRTRRIYSSSTCRSSVSAISIRLFVLVHESAPIFIKASSETTTINVDKDEICFFFAAQ